MNITTTLILASGALALISPVVYIVSIYAGRSIPHRVTRFVIFVAASISFVSLVSDEKTVALWLAGVFAARGLVLFLVSLHKGVGGSTKIDRISLAIAMVGIALWVGTDQPVWGLLFAIVADFVGFIPAYVKTYKDPLSEGPWFYWLESVAVILTMIAVGAMTFELIFPGYILSSNIIMLVLIYRRQL